jgi:hypothetical protein
MKEPNPNCKSPVRYYESHLNQSKGKKNMKTTSTKSLRWIFLLMLLMGGFGTSMHASGGPMPTPTNPPSQVSFGAALSLTV